MGEAVRNTSSIANFEKSRLFDIESIRRDFPIFSQTIYNKPLTFLDSGASSQKPKVVIDAVSHCYETYYSNVHRGAHYLSQQSTDAFEASRALIAKFVNAGSEKDIVFTSGVTESINLVAAAWGRKFLTKGDEIIVTEMEHHSNIVPWQLLEIEIGVVLRVAPINDCGEILLEEYEKLLSEKTKLVAITECSNVLGTMLPVKKMTKMAHKVGAVVLVDGAQGAVHKGVDVKDIDCEFYGFTGHKLYGPTGIGVLYGKADILESLPPYKGGGEMIEKVSFSGTTFKDPPYRFEAGTPPIAQAIGLARAIEYVSDIGFEQIISHEKELVSYGTDCLNSIDGLSIFGNANDKAGIFSFIVDGIHPFDLGAVLDRQGIAVRVGQHCAEPLMDRLGIEGTVRASLGLYNNVEDIDALVMGINKAKKILN